MLFNNRNKILTIFLLQLSVAYGSVSIQDEWAILSPSHGQKEGPVIAGTHENLKTLGALAHNAWKDQTNLAAKATALNNIFEPVNGAFLISVINEIIESEQLLEEVLKASYKNITGFIKIVLVSENKHSWKLRLHVWDQKEKEYPHNHKWDFFSKILSSYLIQDNYTPTEEGSVQYSIREPLSLMPLLPDGTMACPCRDNYILAEKEMSNQYINLENSQRTIVGVYETYFMPNHLIHTITPGKNAITFVFTSEQVTDNSEVFVPVGTQDSDLKKFAPSLTKEELINELTYIKNVLSKLNLSPKYLSELIHPKHFYFNRNNYASCDSNIRLTTLQKEQGSVVRQLSPTEKDNYTVRANSQGNITIAQGDIESNVDYLFVLIDQTMYVYPKSFTHEKEQLICHTSFTDYAPVDAAGIIKVNDLGELIVIEAYSGHYEPSIKHMVKTLSYLNSIGIDTSKTVIANYQDRV